MTRREIPIVSLFSGCGAMDLGFIKQGFRPVVAIDNDQIALDTYIKHHKSAFVCKADLSKMSGREVIGLIEQHASGTRPRGVIGGPPCQSFSLGNVNSKLKDRRHQLPLHYAEILETLNSKYHLDFFLFENVVGLKSEKHKKRFGRILGALENAGFNIFEQELNASWFKVAQSRRRIFVVGINKELYPKKDFLFPKGSKENVITVREAIGGLPEPAFFRRNLQRSEIPFHPNHWTMNPKSPKFNDATRNRELSSEKNGRSFRKLNWDKPSWTVAYGHNEIHVHPNGRRRLSIFEAMRIQGFPDDYELLGNLTQQVKLVSDAVPPPVASAIAESIKLAIYDSERKIRNRLLKWFTNSQRRFPWRETTDPYAILLAEKLLQQTSASPAVVDAYKEILATYPTVEALSKARSTDVARIIAALGFNYRATELLGLSRHIALQHGGKVPNDLKQLVNLPGIGDYIARAVLCFAFGQPVPIVDTNVARFLYRVYGLAGSLPTNPARDRLLIDLGYNLVPLGRARNFNLAILDLCAKICTKANPSCKECPVQEVCEFGKEMLGTN